MPDNKIGGGGGFYVSVGLTLGGAKGSGIKLSGLNVSTSSPSVGNGARDFMMPHDDTNPYLIMGAATAGSILLGAGIRALRGKKAFTTRDAVLDGLVGVQLGAGLVPGRAARAVFTGGLFSLPLQVVNRLVDHSWDYRVGMLSQGAVNLMREEAGGMVVPFQGFRRDSKSGEVSLKTSELIGNATTEIGMDALYYGLGNSLAAIAQGKRDRAIEMGKVGAIYGGSVSLLTNIAIGAPVQVEKDLIEQGRKQVLQNGGRDLAGIAEQATWRMGGLAQLTSDGWGITLPGVRPNIWMSTSVAEDPTVIPHESIHLWHVNDQGLMSFYTRYLIDTGKAGGYGRGIPTEMEAYHFTEPLSSDRPYNGDSMYGDWVGLGTNLTLFGLASWLLIGKQ